MFLVDVSSKKFNSNSSIIKNDYTLSYSIFGNYVIDGLVGPTGASSIDRNKKISLLKTHHETLERTSLMIGGYEHDTNYVKVFNLVDGKIKSIDISRTRYSLEKKTYSDTTGTGVHLRSSEAIYKAITELLEKNNLFLFWYGKYGNVLPEHYYNSLDEFLYFKKIKLTVKVFYINELGNLHTFISFVLNDNKILSTGISGDLNWYSALKRSLNEARIILWQNEFLDQRKVQKKRKKSASLITKDLHNFLESKSVFSPNNQQIKYDDLSDYNKKIRQLVTSLPQWIESMYILLLKNNSNAKCVLCYSNELFNGLPKKEFVDLNKEINKNTINLNISSLKKYPECIVV